MTLPAELEEAAFRPKGTQDWAWRREHAGQVVCALAAASQAILGGELWLVRNGEVWASFPQPGGLEAIYTWECDRLPEEQWPAFAARSAHEALAAIQRFPDPQDLPAPGGGDIYYNLVWASEVEARG